jgi:hypothetical protein
MQSAYFEDQSTFMSTNISGLNTLQDIRNMMEKSSRFISLSGWSGISAGICGLAGAWFAWQRINAFHAQANSASSQCIDCLKTDLLVIASLVFAAAFATAFFFTFLRSRRDGSVLWGPAARRLLWNTLFPMLAGGLVILRLVSLEQYDIIISVSLIFYGLALINGSRYTIGEVRYLGYAELATGLISLWLPELGLYLWAIGFGLLHIVYGIAMWWKYERTGN